MAVNHDKPIGFLKFIIVSSLVMTVARALLLREQFFANNRSSVVPFAVGLWIFYRFARVQPWWPFSVSASKPSSKVQGASDFQHVKIPDVYRERAKPLKPGYKRRLVSEKYTPIAVPASLISESLYQVSQRSDEDRMTAKEFAASKMSNVGTRSKVPRFKIQRSKTVRSKKIRTKRQAFTPVM